VYSDWRWLCCAMEVFSVLLAIATEEGREPLLVGARSDADDSFR